MTKLLVIPNEKTDCFDLLKQCDGLILPIEDMSIHYSHYYTVTEACQLISQCKEMGKEVFVSLNKNIHQAELKRLDQVLASLPLKDITGLLFADVCFPAKQLDVPLVFAQEHFTTNYKTINYWKQYGVAYAYLSGELTMEELLTIIGQAEVKTMVPVFGYLPMTTTYRTLTQNYLEYTKQQRDGMLYYLESNDQYYPLYEQKQGSFLLSSHVLDLYQELPIFSQAACDYVVMNGTHFDGDFLSLVKLYANRLRDETEDQTERVKQLIGHPTDKGFLYKETVYRVIS